METRKNTMPEASVIAEIAHRALLEEVSVTPKPGLVDRHSSGAHHDMDFVLFVDSAHALAPYWHQLSALGNQMAANADPVTLFQAARQIGLQAETAMFAATGGVNTHKGLIFSLGVLCTVCGQLRGRHVALQELLAHAATLADPATADFATPPASPTNGLILYKAAGIGGVRIEAAAGFPSVSEIALPALQTGLAAGESRNDAALRALLCLIGTVEDTCAISRSSPAEWRRIADQTARFMRGNPDTKTMLDFSAQLDTELSARHISPGGSADLLALALFLFALAEGGWITI